MTSTATNRSDTASEMTNELVTLERRWRNLTTAAHTSVLPSSVDTIRAHSTKPVSARPTLTASSPADAVTGGGGGDGDGGRCWLRSSAVAIAREAARRRRCDVTPRRNETSPGSGSVWKFTRFVQLSPTPDARPSARPPSSSRLSRPGRTTIPSSPSTPFPHFHARCSLLTAAPRLPERRRRRQMSAPAMPTPVSRLPKFASWSKSSSLTPAAAVSHAFPAARLPNGFYHHPGPAGDIGAANGPARRIGSVRTPAEYSAKWRKDAEVTDGGGRVDRNEGARRNARPHASAVAPKTADTSLPVCKTEFPVPKTGLPVPKNRLPVSKLSLTGSKQNLNGLSGSKLRPPQWSAHSGPASSSSPGSGCGSSPPAARSRSTGNLGSAPPSRLAKGDGFRPLGLAVRRRASPGAPASSLSAEPGHERSRTSCVRAGPLGGPGGVKKSLLPAPGANGVSYKLSRPSLAKQTRTGAAEVSRARPKTSAGSSPERSPEAPERDDDPSVPGETPEDMSLSSGSSVDRNRAGREYLDVFDHPGNGGAGVFLLAETGEDDSGPDRSGAAFCDRRGAGNGVTVATELHFLDETLDWTNGDDGQNHLTRLRRHSGSSPSDCHERGGSSLDLSPSDSCGSGGIYMWDEEGLEPLGGAVVPRAAVDCGLGAFRSDVTDSDALTNVDSCDLDDDDLMLDGDFPDDVSLNAADGGGTSHMAEWRRRQLCWGTQDVHSDDREPGRYDLGKERDDAGVDADLAADLSPHRTPDVDVEDLAEDLGALRSQLEVLRRFLQDDDTDDDTLTTDTLSPEDGHRSQVEALLREVQQLKEDLRSKEQIISQLTLQLAVAPATGRCRCPTDGEQKTPRHTRTDAARVAGFPSLRLPLSALAVPTLQTLRGEAQTQHPLPPRSEKSGNTRAVLQRHALPPVLAPAHPDEQNPLVDLPGTLPASPPPLPV
ncbi:mucin-19-like [Phyllopteryx taeniolatus]|uniref:mucin-19-like n=1 Tax=Phyllopteryx taeniolatus TaxID=161469 RepID=UPI002AD54C96|nr:mucin-19-like [Phyllopteryx taeniolatus]